MFDRVLKTDLENFIKATERFKWRFFEIIDEDTIRVEIPKGDENLVIYVANNKDNRTSLEVNYFIEQEVKTWRAF